MKVVVMDTGRGIDERKVALWRSHLGLGTTDELSLVSWFAPKVHLPLARTLVCGPVLRLGQEPTDWPVLPTGAGPATDLVPSSAPEVGGAAGAVEGAAVEEAAGPPSGGLGVPELDEQLSEQEAGPVQAAAADQDPDRAEAEDGGGTYTTTGPRAATGSHETGPTEGQEPTARSNDLSHLPVHHPRRLRQAVRWRSRRAQRRASRLVSAQVRRVKRVTTRGAALPDDWRKLPARARDLPSTSVRKALSERKDGISWEFALAATRSSAVGELFRSADLVVPVDERAQKAAWLLARRHRGPDVYVTLPSGARALAARRARH
ncbi:hypothetical protein [Ornithinimicrobium sp. W1665]|uniref:hypothetical protein n=1 Tax=Ornithinimicrobium sp. W1665 TaxID=3416666 RepID=UPI003CEEFDDA